MNVNIPKNGEVRATDEGKVEVFQRDHWQETDMSVSGGEIDTGMNLYDLNKQIISQMPNLTPEQIKEKYSLINNFDYQQQANYYMLLCNDLKYYTLFHVSDARLGNPCLWSEIGECLKEFADGVKSIELTEGESAIEIWIEKENEVYVMYFFNYDTGVINCER